MNPMNTAPKDREIDVLSKGTWYLVSWQDCKWMRDEGEDIADAWAIDDAMGPGHVEVGEAEGWLPAGTITEKKPQRCGECDCNAGGADCNWIKSGPNTEMETSE